MSFYCSLGHPGWRGVSVPVVWGGAECHHRLSGAAQSVNTCCPVWRRVSPPVVRGGAECLPPVVQVDAENLFESNSIQKPHKNKMFQCCLG